MINIAEHNRKVEEIKRAQELLNAGIPKVSGIARCNLGKDENTSRKSSVWLRRDGKAFNGNASYSPASKGEQQYISISELRELAACTIALTGPITEVELAKVVIE